MRKYKCEACEKVFDSDDVRVERVIARDEFGLYHDESEAYCPFCGSQDFDNFREEEYEEYHELCG